MLQHLLTTEGNFQKHGTLRHSIPSNHYVSDAGLKVRILGHFTLVNSASGGRLWDNPLKIRVRRYCGALVISRENDIESRSARSYLKLYITTLFISHYRWQNLLHRGQAKFNHQ